jgi:hypothetical protein
MEYWIRLASPDIIAVGTLVLQNKIAPLSRIIFVISASPSSVVGALANAV